MVISNVQVRKVCQVPGCGSTVLAKGYCCKHYYQVKRHGAVGLVARRCGLQPAGAPRVRASRFGEGGEPFGPAGAERATAATRCTARGCALAVFDQRLCRLHYIKLRHLGMIGAAEAALDDEAAREETWDWMAEAVKD